MAETPTLESVASEALRYFKRKKRDNGDEFYCCTDDAPSWVRYDSDDSESDESIVWKGHGDGEYLPDDHRYDFIVQALSALSDGDEDGDGLEPDVYNSDLYAWLSSHGSRAGYVDEASRDRGGLGSFDSIMDAIGAGQLAEKREVFEAVKACIEARIEAIEEALIEAIEEALDAEDEGEDE